MAEDPVALNEARAFTLAKYGEWKEFQEIMEGEHVSIFTGTDVS